MFAVLAGRVAMRVRLDGTEHRTVREAGDVFLASSGTEPVARPIGEARMLVVENEGRV